jgi:HEXXH motif-containing protein
VIDQLGQAQRGIAVVSGGIGAFTTQFIKVLVLQQDGEPSYSAYSTQQYPGRAVMRNPQLVDVALIAESIVHEAIHSLLYMLIQSYPWGIEDSSFEDGPKVTSPWTGRILPLSTFLHACFVWYGLLHFWSRALTTAAFPALRIRGRLSRAALGFLGPSLLTLVDPRDLVLVSAPIRAAIQSMQDRVPKLR